MNPQNRVDSSADRRRPLTNRAIPNPALLTALAAGPRRESPSAFSVEWQLPLPTRDLIVREDNGDVVVDVGDMTSRGRPGGVRGRVAQRPGARGSPHPERRLSDTTKEGVGGGGAA